MRGIERILGPGLRTSFRWCVPGQVHLAPFAVDLYGVPGVAVAGDAAVGDACCVKELGVDALVALAGALVAREAAFGRAPVEAVVVLQPFERPVVEPQRHVVFRAVCLLSAQVHGAVDDLCDARGGRRRLRSPPPWCAGSRSPCRFGGRFCRCP